MELRMSFLLVEVFISLGILLPRLFDQQKENENAVTTEYHSARTVVNSFIQSAAARNKQHMNSTLYFSPATNRYQGLKENIDIIPRNLGNYFVRLPWPIPLFEQKWFNYEESLLLEESKAYEAEGTPKAGDLETIATIPVAADSVLNLWFLLRKNEDGQWKIFGWQRTDKPYAHLVKVQLLRDVMPPPSELPFPPVYPELQFVNETDYDLQILLNLDFPDSSLQNSVLAGGVLSNNTEYIGESYPLKDTSQYKGVTVYAFPSQYVRRNFRYNTKITPDNYLSPDSALGKWVLSRANLDSIGWQIKLKE